MKLDRLAAVLRPRRPWEGIDLGFALARAWFPSLWALWWITALPLALLCLPLTGARADLWLIALWWLKPVYEAPLHRWASRALLGEQVPLRAIGPLLRAALPARLLPYLLWYRLGPRRAFAMPLTLLEGLGGRAARQRRRVLTEGDGTAVWLTLIGYHFEAILWGGLLLTLYLLVPDAMPRIDLAAAVTNADSWAYWVSALAYLLALSVIAPFYVCAGFALYLTRRTELEAWDLELAFRKAGEPAPGQRPPARALVHSSLPLLLVVTGMLGITPAPAEPLPSPEQARILIEGVLEDPDFGGVREQVLWVPIADEEDRPDTEEPLPVWLGTLALNLGRILKWGLSLLAAIAVALLVARILRDWQPTWRRATTPTEPAWVQGEPLPSTQDPLPEALTSAVRERLGADDPRGALSLLYRASLARLSACGIHIPDGATEGESLARARQTLADAGPLPALTRAWQQLAYAHHPPSTQQIETLLEGWSRWQPRLDADTVRATPIGTHPHRDD